MIVFPPLLSPLKPVIRGPVDVLPGTSGAAPATYRLLDGSSNFLTDESGNRLTWS